MHKTCGQVGQFALSGFAATAIHTAVATVLILFILVAPPIANVIAFALATAFSYFANTLWTFSSSPSTRTLFRFLSVSVVGSAVAFTAASVAEHFELHYLIGIGFVLLTAPPVTFLLHRLWTYSPVRRMRLSGRQQPFS